MPGTGHVTDPLVGELAGLFERAEARLQGIVGAGLRRGLDASRINTPEARVGDATHAYRARQLAQAQAILVELRGQAGRYGPIVTGRAYRAGALAVDRAIGDGASLAGSFGGVHVRAAEALAANMTGAMTAAIDRTGDNIALVFERANALERGVPVTGVRGFPFIGRRVDDPYRSAALETVGQGLIAQDTRRQVSAALARRLVTEGTADALTGYVTKTGGRIGLAAYTRMVARTTTREAVSRGTVNRLQEGGRDLVEISSHPHKSDECDAYDGQTFSLSGDTPNYDVLDELPPFHPNCLHVLTPAGADLDAWERELSDLLEAPDAQAVAPPARAPRAKASPPASKIQDLIAAERQASGQRAIDDALASTQEHRDAIRARMAAEDAGTADPELGRVSSYARDLVRAEDTFRARIASQGLEDLIGSSIDEPGVMRVGEKVRQLAERRANAARKRLDKLLLERTAAMNEAVDVETAIINKLVGKRSSLRALEEAAANPEAQAAHAITNDLATEVRKLYAELDGARAKAYRDTLAEVRPGFGGGRIDAELGRMGGADADRFVSAAGDPLDPAVERMLRAGVEDASRNLPAEWVTTMERTGKTKLGFWNGRAWHRWEGAGSTIRASGEPTTILHELGHRVEQTIAGIRELEYAFYRRRTALGRGRAGLEPARKLSDITGDKGYRPDERAREDRFTVPYIGKAYGNGGNPSPRDPYEVLTMGLEGLFHGRHGIDRDPDLQAFILGLLASL